MKKSLTIIYLVLAVISYGQTYSLTDPKIITSFPTMDIAVNTTAGYTAIGMQGSCSALPCCSTYVYKVVLPSDGVLRVEMSNFEPLQGSILAYRSLVSTPSDYSDLEYISSTTGNFCGFRDTLQLGRGVGNWDAVPYGQIPLHSGLTDVYDFSSPSSNAGFFPAGDYYILFFNRNNQFGVNLSLTTDVSFEFAPACPSSVLTQTICAGESITVNGTTYNSSVTGATETFTGIGINSCDSTVTINLTVLPALTNTLTQTICAGESITVNGTTYNSSVTGATEIFTGIGTNSCDSTVTINLTVLPALTNTLTQTICAGESITVNGTTYNSSVTGATEIFTGIGINSCDSTVTINLTVLPALTNTLTQTICAGQSITVNGTTYNSSVTGATEIFTGIGINSCDSTVTINLTVLPALTNTLTQTICAGESITVNGTTYNSSVTGATEIFTGIGTNSCDSTVTINLTVLPALTNTLTQTICAGESITVNGTTYNSSVTGATEIFTGIGTNSCDSTVTINLTVLPALTNTLTQTICAGESITVNGTTYNSSVTGATEIFTGIGTNSCDSTVTINLTVLPALTENITNTLCFGDSIIINGTTYNSTNLSGIEVFNNIGTNMCDSTVIVNITVESAINVTTTSSANTISADAIGVDYQWIECPNNINIIGAINQTFTASENGIYAVVITKNNCSDTSDCVNITGVGINKILSENKIQLYPNPATNNIIVELNDLKDVNVTIVSVTGKEVFNSKNINQKKLKISTANFPKGIYFVKIESHNLQKVIKLIKN